MGKSKPIRLLDPLFLCALVFLSFCPLFGQEKGLQRVTAPLTTPIQHVLSAPPKKNLPQVNSALPGLGTLPGNFGSPPVFAGSLELLPPESDPAMLSMPMLASRQMEATGNTTLSLPPEKESEPIILSAQSGWCKPIGHYDVYFLQGNCSFQQGQTTVRSPEAVVWIAAERDKMTNRQEVTLYAEGSSAQMPVLIEQKDSQQGTTKITDQKWLGHWYTCLPVEIRIANLLPPQENPPIFKRAVDLMGAGAPRPSSEGIVQTQFLSSSAVPQLSAGSNLGFRQVQLVRRSDNNFNIAFEPYYRDDPARGGIVVLTGGINLIIEGITDATALNMLAGDTVDIAADNAVIWTENPGKIHGGGSYSESDQVDFEIYLEGNIIYRDGPRVIEASRMYYDVKHKVAYILNGHLSAPISDVSGIEGSVRLKADILRQMGTGLFTARNAMVTTSQLGEPSYSLRSQTLKIDRRVSQPLDNSEAKIRQVVVAENNYIAIRNVPAFYWPWIATDVEDPTFYLKNVSYSNGRRNGHTVRTLWNPFQILNIRRPDGVDGDVNITWMEKRGIGHGATFHYARPSCCSIPGPAHGDFTYWGLHDRGSDQLGGSRDSVSFPHSYRYRLHWIHQQQLNLSMPLLTGPWDFRAEIGKVSDRNFLNSFFNSVWHTEENATTAVDLTRREKNQSCTLSAEYALDKCYSNANWLPRLDHYWLGESLFNDYLTWYEHSRIGFTDYHRAGTPSDPVNDPFAYLPWETDNGTGVAFSTRHELDLPIQAGALKIIPYVLGDFSVWGEDQTGNAADRLYGQGGVRMNLPIWKVNPRVSSRTWYLNGLAHKIDLDAEYLYAQANRSMDNLTLTDPLDQWSIDDFRRRYVFTNSYFGGSMFDSRFDPRYYALRSGLASNVTAGNMEIADDMHMFRLGTTHRFQTKRGSVGKRHILDWITVSTHINLYPQAQYNHGQGAGLFDYNVLWHVGDRFSLFSEGLYDFFNDGQNLTRFGGIWNRPDRGSVSITLDQFSGVVERTYLSLGIGYAMNEKYSMSYRTSYDLRERENVGHNLMFVRTGESFRLLVGAVYSEALSEWSFSIGLEPVFLRQSRRGAAVY